MVGVVREVVEGPERDWGAEEGFGRPAWSQGYGRCAVGGKEVWQLLGALKDYTADQVGCGYETVCGGGECAVWAKQLVEACYWHVGRVYIVRPPPRGPPAGLQGRHSCYQLTVSRSGCARTRLLHPIYGWGKRCTLPFKFAQLLLCVVLCVQAQYVAAMVEKMTIEFDFMAEQGTVPYAIYMLHKSCLPSCTQHACKHAYYTHGACAYLRHVSRTRWCTRATCCLLPSHGTSTSPAPQTAQHVDHLVIRAEIAHAGGWQAPSDPTIPLSIGTRRQATVCARRLRIAARRLYLWPVPPRLQARTDSPWTSLDRSAWIT